MNERPQVSQTLVAMMVGAAGGFVSGAALIGLIWWLT